MIPYSDSLRSRTTPYVNWAIIITCFLVWFYELYLNGQSVLVRTSGGMRVASELDLWIFDWGAVPCRLTDQCQRFEAAFPSSGGVEWVNLITSQFIHGGWAHILGNMLFLWVFGDNIEDAMGHARYLIFYLLGGIIAGLAQVASNPDAMVPSVGASGAIAAVLGAYLVTYPRASVSVVIPIIIIPFFTRVPAVLMMGVWFLIQVVSVGAVTGAVGGEGGVAYWAHIGGFVAGMVLALFFRGRRRSYDSNARYEQYRVRW